MLGLAVLLLFNLLGAGLKEWLHLPMPANVIGLVLFTASLYAKIVKLEWVEASAQWLMKHMMLFFIPYIVATLALFRLLGDQWIPLVLSVVVCPLLVLAATGLVAGRLAKRPEGEGASE